MSQKRFINVNAECKKMIICPVPKQAVGPDLCIWTNWETSLFIQVDTSDDVELSQAFPS